MSVEQSTAAELKANGSVLNITFDISAFLETLQYQSTVTFIPAMAFLSLLSAVGLIGNCLVLYVYWRKFCWTPLGVLIMEMSVYDLLINTIVIPGEIYDMFHQWDFDNPDLCRARRFLNVATTIGSGITLVCIGVTRYKRICQPLRKQVTTTQVYVGSIFIALVSLACASPFSLLNGKHTRQTGNPLVNGSSCDVDDAYVKSSLLRINSAFFAAIYLVSASMIIALYWMIWSKARRHRSSMSKRINRSISDSNIAMRKPSLEESSSAPAKRHRLNRMSRSLQALTRASELSEEVSNLDPIMRIDLSTSCVSVQVGLTTEAAQNVDGERHSPGLDTSRKGGDVWMNLISNLARRFSFAKEENSLERSLPRFRKKDSRLSNASSRGVDSFQQTCSTISHRSTAPEAAQDLNSINLSLEIKQINLTSRRLLISPRSKSSRRRVSERRFKGKRRRDFGRTSCMLLTISVVFLLSYLPFTVLQVFKHAAPDLYESLDGPGLALYHLFYRSYLWNSASNPIIYSLCDLKFRQETMKIFNMA